MTEIYTNLIAFASASDDAASDADRFVGDQLDILDTALIKLMRSGN